MTVTPIIPNLHQLIVPTPFPVGPVNVYLADGESEPLTLIDTGPRTRQAQAALEEGLSALGYTLSDIERVVITHAHSDHYGLAGNIVQASGAKVYSHPHNRPQIEDHAAERAKREAFYGQLLIEADVPPAVQAAIAQMTKGYNRFATAVSPIHALGEGDKLALAGRDWQVLFMPGHTGGLICLYQPETRLFLSNDHLLRDISSNPLFEPPMPGQTRRRRSLVDYVASLERTAALDIAVAWSGHGKPIYDHRALIEKRLAFHHRRAEKLLTALQEAPQTAFALCQILFPDLDAIDSFLAISEVLAHLEWLEEQKAITSRSQDGLVFWERL